MLSQLATILCLFPSQPFQDETPERSDDDARAAWSKLDEDARFEVLEWFRSEVVWLDTFQGKLVRFVLDSEEADPGTWPQIEPAPHFDPVKHAPKQPIPRKPLGADDRRVSKLKERVFFRVPKRRLQSAWVYDYTTGGLAHGPDVDSHDRIFANALAGFPPELDLAEALVERALDDESQRERLTTFANAYTDRSGNIYPGVTLYDAWSSGIEMEMPDVDVLGVIHTLEDDWKTWVAPVPERKHEALYDRVGELFVPARRHRGLRHALARTYLSASPAMRDGYSGSTERFHALWDSHGSTPTALAEVLPNSKDWEEFLSDWVGECDKDDYALLRKGRVRRATLEADENKVRALLISVLERFGAFQV